MALLATSGDVRYCAAIVKVFGCRPHDGSAAHTGAGVRKPPMEETAGRDTSGGAAWVIEN